MGLSDDDDPDCIHGIPKDLPCSICLHGPSKSPYNVEPERVESVFAAGFAGHCRDCNLPIVPGQSIAKLVPSNRYVHADCAP